MKKTILTSLLLVSVFVGNTQVFKAKITYEATLDNSTYYNRLINDTTITEFSRNAKLEDIQTTRPMNFMLFINGTVALYKAEFSLPEQKRLGLGPNRTGAVARDDNTYYTNLLTNERFYQNFFTPEILVNMDKVDWVLTNESKKIGVYTCYKAIATITSKQLNGMNFLSPIIAWYTPEIPTSYGIQSFNGLPGLTLELITDYESGKVVYKAIGIDLNPENVFIEKPTGNRQISQQDYIEYIKKLNENRF
jgi:GLPGLI family protein